MANKLNFIACDNKLNESEIVLLGLPYDGTSSYRPGSRFAPGAIREASDGLETYSPYLDKDLLELNIFDAGDLLLPFGDKDRTIGLIRNKIKSYVSSERKVLSMGGEHLATYPIIKEYHKHYSDLLVFQFDAHADLRDSYIGEKESHATVMRRIYQLLGKKKVYQFGIRSGTSEEFKFGKEKGNFYPFHLNNVTEVLSNIDLSQPIYITIDLDVLDPSILPGTGTPEPGGVSFNQLLQAIHQFNGKNIVGADVVELAPDYDSSKVSSVVAAKIIRELLLMF